MRLISDHLPVLFTSSKFDCPKIIKKVPNYKHADWVSFKKLLNTRININSKISTINDVNEAVNNLTNQINDTN